MQRINRNIILSIYVAIVSILVFGNLLGLVSDIFASSLFILIGVDMFFYALFSDYEVVDGLSKIFKIKKRKKKQTRKSSKITKRNTFGQKSSKEIYNSDNKIVQAFNIFINFQISLFCSSYLFVSNIFSRKDGNQN